MTLDWNTVVAAALNLPGTVAITSYGNPAIGTEANGRAFLTIGPDLTSFVLAIDHDSKAMLIETDPDTFWETPHYVGWPAILVRYDSPDPKRVFATIGRARDWNATRKRVKTRAAPSGPKRGR